MFATQPDQTYALFSAPVSNSGPLEGEQPGEPHFAPLRMGAQPTEHGCRYAMQPVKLACHVHTGFIEVRNGRPLQRLPDLCDGRPEPMGRIVDAVLNGACAQPHAEQISQRLRRTVHRQLLVLRQVHDGGFDLRSVLRRPAHACRKHGTMHFPAVALCPLDAMLRNFKTDGRQVNNLPRFGRNRDGLARDRLATSVAPRRDRMNVCSQ
ncbi:hypothetical protein LMG26411_08221 [Cupriavidus numazuensis]|uniref:Uncharacterized protein n=1 Tax=Cupriavidus numazuensis TaxID=221992 RepID=A0ABM8TWY1_9BURK|nr:hypothetical protein LMG26411_08221 [Cupriavidus numazuensis]